MPPFVAFSIGSFGDILAVLQLLYKLRDALNELTGAAAEMRVLIDDIDRMTRALIQVKAALERRGSQIQADIANGIRVAVATCEDILRAALGSIEDFKRRIICATGPLGWRAYCAVLGWSVLGGKQRVEDLRARLSEQIDVIQLYLALSQSCGQAKIQESLEAQGATLRRLCDVVQDIQLRFDVGIPSFMFWDKANGNYCQPLGRTSLARFREIYEHYTGLSGNDLLPPHGGTEVRRFSLEVPGQKTSRTSTQFSYGLTSMDCFIFQENAFGQWQALVSRPFGTKDVADHAPVIKILLERPHGPRRPCNCIGESCRSRLQPLLERCAMFRKRLDTYEAAANSLADSMNDQELLRPLVHDAARVPLISADSARLFQESVWGRTILGWHCDLDRIRFQSAIRRLSRSLLITLLNLLFKEACPNIIIYGSGQVMFMTGTERLLDLI